MKCVLCYFKSLVLKEQWAAVKHPGVQATTLRLQDDPSPHWATAAPYLDINLFSFFCKTTINNLKASLHLWPSVEIVEQFPPAAGWSA